MDLSEFVVRQDGLIQLSDGRLLIPISGGRGAGNEDEEEGTEDEGGDEDVDNRPLTLKDLETALAPMFQYVQKIGSTVEQQQSQFDELVDALAQVADEEEESGEEEEDVEQQRDYRTSRAESEEIARERRERLKLQKQLEEVQRQVAERDEAVEEQHEMWLASERDRLLSEALQKAGVLPDGIEAGIKLFRESIVFDDEDQNFYFYEESTGVKLPVVEGITDNLPDFLKETKIRMGGSGGRGSQASSLLDKAKKDLEAAKEKAQKSGQDSDIAQYHGLKKKVGEMEKSINEKPGSTRAPSRPTPRTPVPVAAEEESEE